MTTCPCGIDARDCTYHREPEPAPSKPAKTLQQQLREADSPMIEWLRELKRIASEHGGTPI